MRGALSICIQPEENEPPASSRSDDDERSAQLDMCGAQADNESADVNAVRGVDQLSSVPTPHVKPRLARTTSTEQVQPVSEWVHLWYMPSRRHM